ncbi:MAG: DUF721 domain-containing protein [Actinobacteria bacterium]|nr:DUF721 domain-containing protein [Actinomycetota bacterium]
MTRRNERPIKPLGEALEWLTRELGLEDQRPAVAVQEHWAAIAGEEVAAHARAKRLTDGVLTVEVDEPAWATHIRSQSDGLIQGLNEAIGTPALREIRVVVGRPMR